MFDSLYFIQPFYHLCGVRQNHVAPLKPHHLLRSIVPTEKIVMQYIFTLPSAKPICVPGVGCAHDILLLILDSKVAVAATLL